MPYRRTAGVTFEVADGRAVLLDAEGAMLTTLNPSGTSIWEGLDGRRGVPELAERLAEEHPEVPLRTLEADVQVFLGELVDDGLVEHTGAAQVAEPGFEA
ncbi:MAG: PqqD family protein [Actinomycetota bacterium]